MKTTAEHINSSPINLRIPGVEEYGDEKFLGSYIKMPCIWRKLTEPLCTSKWLKHLLWNFAQALLIKVTMGVKISKICPTCWNCLLYAISVY